MGLSVMIQKQEQSVGPEDIVICGSRFALGNPCMDTTHKITMRAVGIRQTYKILQDRSTKTMGRTKVSITSCWDMDIERSRNRGRARKGKELNVSWNVPLAT